MGAPARAGDPGRARGRALVHRVLAPAAVVAACGGCASTVTVDANGWTAEEATAVVLRVENGQREAVLLQEPGPRRPDFGRMPADYEVPAHSRLTVLVDTASREDLGDASVVRCTPEGFTDVRLVGASSTSRDVPQPGPGAWAGMFLFNLLFGLTGADARSPRSGPEVEIRLRFAPEWTAFADVERVEANGWTGEVALVLKTGERRVVMAYTNAWNWDHVDYARALEFLRARAASGTGR